MENKLISMTDFVLELEKPVGYYEDQNDFLHKQVEFMSLTMNYAKFLKQHLMLGMFIPVDESGNLLSMPTDYEYYISDNEQYFNGDEIFCDQYTEAMKNVLFDVKLTRREDISYCVCYRVSSKEFSFHFDYYPDSSGDKTIEDIIKFKLPLTESALKQIGLKTN